MKTEIEQRVASALVVEDLKPRMKAIAELKQNIPSEALAAIVSLLDSPDQKIRRRAGSALSSFRDSIVEHGDALAGHLQRNPDPVVRLSCAIMLSSVRTPAADFAYIHAVADSDEKVATLACFKTGERVGAEGTRALFNAITNRPWRIRLTACSALINQGTADDRVVSVLEAMRREPEAAIYDQEQKEFSEGKFSEELSEVFSVDLSEPTTVESFLVRARALAKVGATVRRANESP